MTTRDPRSGASPPLEPQGYGRDPTQSLALEDGFDDPAAHPSLALGTHEAGRTKLTSVESPVARGRTPVPHGDSLRSPARIGPPPIPRAATAADEPDRVGSILGSYKVLEVLGRGGMGHVFRAEHVKLGREVALKLLRSDYARRRDAVARFFQEARTVNRVRHRNIVDVTDFVELDDGTTFIIMEYLRGQSLGKWARTGIDLPRALAVLVQICDGLGAAHEVGVIHRDLKPDNVIIVPTADGAELAKLLDFGVAKLVNRDDEDVGFQTAAGSVIGTPAYMSPEQAGGMAVDPRSDIYSLGAIMYELFCGQPMFRGRSFGEYVRKHLTEMPVPPRQTAAGAGIDPRLEALIMKCLEKDPIQRFPRITELRDALLTMLGGMETHLPGLVSLSGSGVRSNVGASVSIAPLPQLPVVLSSPSGPLSSPSGLNASQQAYFNTSHVSRQTAVGSPTSWWVWFVGGAIAVGLGIGAAVWYAGRTDLSPPPPASPGAAPVSQPAPIAEPIAPSPVEVTLDSTPAGTVFAEGSTSALCRTPCTYSIDPKDGGAADHRTYVVRAEGYQDGYLVVDLKGSQRDFTVTLEAREELTADPGEKAADPGEKAADPGEDQTADPDDRTGKTAAKPGPRQRPLKRPAIKKADDRKADDRKADDRKADDRTDTDTDLIEPPRPPRKKPDPGPIDPTDTLDPFRPRS